MQQSEILLDNGAVSAEIALLGAELVAFRDGAGRDLLWNGDAAYWANRAPLLFPIVGRLPDDTLVHKGEHYGMGQHGLARRRAFEVVETTSKSVTFRLIADEATHAQYPFDFELLVTYALSGAGLGISVTAHNTGDEVMPASIGFHPAFLWPLPYGGAREEHVMIFEEPEPAPIRRPTAYGLLAQATEPSPLTGTTLALDDALFEPGALVFTTLASRRIRYGVPGEPGLKVTFEGMPHLGIWTKPGARAPFVCIEPWQGFATPEGGGGEFVDKPGLVMIAPGTAFTCAMHIHLVAEI